MIFLCEDGGAGFGMRWGVCGVMGEDGMGEDGLDERIESSVLGIFLKEKRFEESLLTCDGKIAFHCDACRAKESQKHAHTWANGIVLRCLQEECKKQEEKFRYFLFIPLAPLLCCPAMEREAYQERRVRTLACI